MRELIVGQAQKPFLQIVACLFKILETEQHAPFFGGFIQILQKQRRPNLVYRFHERSAT